MLIFTFWMFRNGSEAVTEVAEFLVGWRSAFHRKADISWVRLSEILATATGQQETFIVKEKGQTR